MAQNGHFPSQAQIFLLELYFLQDGFCLPIKLLFPQLLCLFSSPQMYSVIKKKDAHHLSLCQGTERSYTAQNVPILFIPKQQGGLISWHLFTRKKGGEEILSPPALTMGCCSTWLCLTSCRTLGCSLTSPPVNWGHVLSRLRPEKKKNRWHKVCKVSGP